MLLHLCCIIVFGVCKMAFNMFESLQRAFDDDALAASSAKCTLEPQPQGEPRQTTADLIETLANSLKLAFIDVPRRQEPSTPPNSDKSTTTPDHPEDIPTGLDSPEPSGPLEADSM
jgi:hypothetical protein